MVPRIIGRNALFRFPFGHLVLIIVSNADTLVVRVGKRVLRTRLPQVTSSVATDSGWGFEISRARRLRLVSSCYDSLAIWRRLLD